MAPAFGWMPCSSGMLLWFFFLLYVVPYWLALVCDYISCAVNLLVRLLLAFSVPVCQDCGVFLSLVQLHFYLVSAMVVDGYFPCLVEDFHYYWLVVAGWH